MDNGLWPLPSASPLEFWGTLLPYFTSCDKVRHKDIFGLEFWETLLPTLVRQVCRPNIWRLEFGTFCPPISHSAFIKPTPMFPHRGRESRHGSVSYFPWLVQPLKQKTWFSLSIETYKWILSKCHLQLRPMTSLLQSFRHSWKPLQYCSIACMFVTLDATSTGAPRVRKKGSLRKGSFQRSPSSRGSRELRDSRDSWEPPDRGKQPRIRPCLRELREHRDY